MIVNRRRPAALTALLALALPLLPAADALAAPAAPTAVETADTGAVRLELPAPTGPYAVGRDTLHLTDTDRTDPWVPSAGARELMVSLYYPAHARTGSAAAYMTTGEAEALLESQGLAGAVPAETVASTELTARDGARPAGGRHPLVVLSPGFSLQRGTLTLLAEDLASRGYVVAAVDHAYESVGTLFPGGRMLTCVACVRVEEGEDEAPEGGRNPVLTAVAEGRAADVSFVVDELTRRGGRWARLIDADRIGMAGHSIGGDAAAATMAADPRVVAGVNLDGTFFAPMPAGGLDGRPFLMMGTENLHVPGGDDDTWDTAWDRLDGWRRWLTVADAGHFSFIDVPVLGAQLGITDPEFPLPGDRSGEITRDYTGAFFDLHLRGVRQPLLDGPTEGNPEVSFHAP
ncbi:alpha/beta hydrolase [Streptomyces sp. RFCAC02]|uniref:alpha/beta hydrolase family protein n=1 Tax=Streptomyces sp. RFCAC02 TaxID=2499143 RepID=UPI0010211665|nr:alpha/beta hydrolase [Streptomyces sp. RFCAC02]